MSTILVYHVKNLTVPGGRSLLGEIGDGFLPIDFPNNHELVAEVEVHSEGNRGLDEAYKLTQNIEDSWTKNAFVQPKGTRFRSTHIGDVLVIREIPYVCSPMGWRMVMSADQKVRQ